MRNRPMSTPQSDKAPALNIRIKAPQRALIAQAARRANKTISDFVRDAAIHEAESILLDTTRIELDPEAWAELTAALDAPPTDNPRLRDLLSRKAPWER